MVPGQPSCVCVHCRNALRVMWSRDLSAPSKGSVFQLFTDELPRNILACDRVRMHAVPVILDHGLLIGISPDPQCLWVSFGVSGAGLSDVRPSGTHRSSPPPGAPPDVGRGSCAVVSQCLRVNLWMQQVLLIM